MDKFGRFAHTSSSGERERNDLNIRVYAESVRNSLNYRMNQMHTDLAKKIAASGEGTNTQIHNCTKSISQLSRIVSDLRMELKEKKKNI